MPSPSIASWLVTQEARALLTRLGRVKPFALQETMLPAAALTTAAQTAIEFYLANGRRRLRRELESFIRSCEAADGASAAPEQLQRRYAILRLKFNVVLSQFDLFSDALSQRSERDNGVWLAGLDVAAADGLQLRGVDFQPPPVVCYLARGLGGSIRRARTRLPGGGSNPVAMILIPRERMVGAGVASSLFHEVGHQAAALLGLVDSLAADIGAGGPGSPLAWELFRRWMSEIVADLWAIAKVGVISTLGLVSTLTLPRRFVFRFNPNDPHPIPWFRVLLSCALGDALYPHPQWQQVAASWRQYYPRTDIDARLDGILRALERALPAFVERLLAHAPPPLRGHGLGELLRLPDRDPQRLAQTMRAWHANPTAIRRATPSLIFAVMGQARFDGRITPEQEGQLLSDLLAFWALRGTIDSATLAATALARRAPTVELTA